jgi:hypothetical protein|tara:strand:- start:332 stop:826 length:495 start_codon:yes stop_codon:yes gene_type:complete
MNIFYLDKEPVIAAQMMCDKHVVKMILESAQLLSTAHRVLDGDVYADSVGLYKTAHKNHPSTIWTRASVHNYMWLYNHMISLMQEYTCRYGKHHASERLVAPLRKTPTTIPVVDFSDPPQCMPDYCKTEDTVSAYRYYYINEKASFAKWKNAKIPEWFNVGAAA